MSAAPPAGRLVDAAGGTVCAGDTWVGALGASDARILARAVGPVLDVGCGPARHALALAEAGIPVLGIDVTPRALDRARARGVPVLERGVFERVPGSGRWATVLLLDGNVGIGADPTALLRRVARLLRADGRVLVEAAPTGSPAEERQVALELDGVAGPSFGWATVAIDTIVGSAAAAGLVVLEVWEDDRRWFAELRRAPGAAARPGRSR